MAPRYFSRERSSPSRLRRNRVVTHFRTRAFATFAGAVALTMLAAACSSSKGTSGTTPAAQQVSAGWQGLNPGTGAPQTGGTLNMIGVSDVEFMDYDTAYYTTDSLFDRMTL